MSPHPVITGLRQPRRRSRPVRRLLAAMVALPVLVTLAACQGTVAATPSPAVPVLSAPLEKADLDAWLDGMLPAALERVEIAGAGVAVVHDGEVLTSRGYGWAETGAGTGVPVPVDPARTLFRPGSISKVVTATAVMQLVERGQLDLDTDVRAYLDFELPLDRGAVTLRHLLTHTAGFEERVAGLIRLDGAPVDLRRAVSTDPPEQLYTPGTVPAYSNYGNALAGYVVERISGVRFEDHVREAVLVPAGMTSATFEQPLPSDLAGRVSHGYPDASAPAAPFEHVGESPAGGLSATVDDMSAFMLAQLGRPVTGEPVLAPETLDLMHAPALDADTLGTLAAGPRMTLGLHDESRNGHRILGHGGDTQFFHSHLQLYPEQGTGIFITLNSSGTGALDTIGLRDALVTGFADRYFPAESNPVTVDVDPAESLQRARAAEGSYRSSRSLHSTFLSVTDLTATTRVVAQPDGRLLVQPAQGLPATLHQEVAPGVWREVGGEGVLTVRTVGERVTALGTGPASTLLPVVPGRSPTVAVPVLLVSVLVLLGSVLTGVALAVVRFRRPSAGPGAPRFARRLTRFGAGLTLVALVGWLVVVQALTGLQQVPFTALRVLQVLQALGALAVVPAAVVVLQEVRSRAGWWRTAAAVLVLLALVGTAWFAVTFKLLAPSVSY
ncbi:serine hydrolase domain-containing protein [Auraticoccus monumenti]|uniref:CubicO group peptidase, beta-lactamase class C family n=1 Tax=Auraticoccus monumenti TaxID=675864 RepID=A0A1G7BRN0_9ACTN|nr:serine hydrolase domain-containing protein [Auraticoccus monumenti]SDE29729.1 CubicO group peptidase, beta-lactamase class C family [Auraticoccus monumenti]